MKRFALLLLLLAVACTNERPLPTVSTTEDQNKPQEGGTLIRRLQGDVNTLNPVMAQNVNDRYVAFYLFTPLIHLDAELQPIPGLAEKWEISSDGRQYTFHLNPAATFSDGSPVRAGDVLFTLKKIVDPQTEAPQIAGGFDQLDLKATHVVDDHTIVIAFKEAFAPQMTHFNDLLVLPEHVYGRGDFKSDFTSRVVGQGPYRLVRRVQGKEILLERRPEYWGPRPLLQRVLFKAIADDNTAWNAMKRGEIDETQISTDVWAAESRRPELQRMIDFRRFYTLNYNYVAWNTRNPTLSDKRLRHALAMCIDLKSIIENLYRGTARAMNGPFTPDQWAYNPEVPVIEYNPQEAVRTLRSLGWLDTDKDGILDKNKKPLRIEMMVVGGNAPSTSCAQLFQAELKKIGVQLDIVTLDFGAFSQRLLAGNYESAYLNWNLDPDPDPFPLFHSSQFPPRGQNFVFYSNPEADRLMEAGRRELDQAKRKLIYRQLHALLADDQPYTWTVQVSSKWALSMHIRDAKESKGWGLFLWYPGELGWWIPIDQRTHDTPPRRR
ncbi:MAG TPA: ABC transporter substrate-binding protein [Thermoanaerobaculia bacterium]